VAERRYEAGGEAGRNDSGQQEARRNGGRAREGHGPREGYVDCHETAIGTRSLSLERGMPRQPAPSASGSPFARSNGTNKRQCGHLKPRARGALAPVMSSASKLFPQCGHTTW